MTGTSGCNSGWRGGPYGLRCHTGARLVGCVRSSICRQRRSSASVILLSQSVTTGWHSSVPGAVIILCALAINCLIYALLALAQAKTDKYFA